ncbi:hypothetical protein GCM10009613_15990 [Pseudonocardia kongjuensis]|uniref:FAD synthase n=1 Tax=Pseudonocardia kongjuensis TaxID=102227 RepID=A0ABN1XMQ7_9PSEU
MPAALISRPDRPGTGVPLWRGPDEVPAGFGPCVVSLGVFDGLHRGHRRIVDRARAAGRRLGLPVLLATFDPHPARVLGLAKDTAALSTVEHRAELAARAGVDAVCVLRFDRDLARRSPAEFAGTVLAHGLRARAVVVGTNFTFGAGGAGTVHTLAALGRDLGFGTDAVPLLHTARTPCSSSAVRASVRAGDLGTAHRILGRPHRVDGTCRGGAVSLAPGTALPPAGRYDCLVGGHPRTVVVDPAGGLSVDGAGPDGPVSVSFLAPSPPPSPGGPR